MEVSISNSKATGINYPKRMGRNSSNEDFDTSKTKTLYLKEKSVTIDGATGDVLVKLQGPEKTIEQIRKGNIVIGGTFWYENEHPEIEERLSDLDQLEFGTRDLSKVDILKLLASNRITLPF